MAWAWRRGEPSAMGAVTTETPQGSECPNFHFYRILEFYSWYDCYQAHTCYHTLRWYRSSQEKVGCSLSIIMQLPHTTDVLFPSPSPKEGTCYQQWSLRASQTLSLFLEKVTWDSWRVTWFWSDEAAQRWLFLNLPFVSTTPNKCLPAAITIFSGESRTCSFTFQWHSNSLFINVLCKTTEKWFSSQGKDKPFWGLFQPRERYAQADTKNK